METVHGTLCEYWTVVVHIKQGNVNSCIITSETFSRSGLLSKYLKQMQYKKVLLRERKRHTARRVASAHYAALSNNGGYPIQSWVGGTPSSPIQGGFPIQSWPGEYPIQSFHHEDLGSGTPPIRWMRYPHLDLGWGTPLHQLDAVPPLGLWMGYPPSAGWSTPQSGPGMGYPCQLNEVLSPSPPSRPGMGYLPVKVWTNQQTENSTFPHSWDAGHNCKSNCDPVVTDPFILL